MQYVQPLQVSLNIMWFLTKSLTGQPKRHILFKARPLHLWCGVVPCSAIKIEYDKIAQSEVITF